MRKYLLHTLYSTLSICSLSLLVLCAACTEQDGLPSADPQPLTLAISETVPFVEVTGNSNTRIADSGTTLTWENGDKIYLAATITLNGTTTYAYSTATYTISGSTGTWSDPDPALSVPSGATVKIEAIYANGTLSGNIMALTEKNIVMKATSTNITITASTAAIPLKFKSELVRLDITGISNTNTALANIDIPQSIDTQPANGSFSITHAIVGSAKELTTNEVYYVFPGSITFMAKNPPKLVQILYSDVVANQSYPIDMGPDSGTIRPDGEPFVKP
jgi:hypothetical protein